MKLIKNNKLTWMGIILTPVLVIWDLIEYLTKDLRESMLDAAKEFDKNRKAKSDD